MESLFFNITDTSYKVSELFKNKDEHIKRVDISNGVFFLDISLFFHNIDTHIKNLDRMIVICVAKEAHIKVSDNLSQKEFIPSPNSISIFASSKQDMFIKSQSGKKTDIFLLCIADFFLKRYLSNKEDEPIDFLYREMQKNNYTALIDTQSIDALSLYIIEKITSIKNDSMMKSIVCEQNILEFIVHRLKLLDTIDKTLDKDELFLAKNAKEILLGTYVNPPTIEHLAHMCATNESKLKKVFKKVYKSTIYEYVQKLRLERANLLLREQLSNIGEIAKEVGYKHQGHFSKLFFETYGVYPKDLLKKG